MIATLPPGTSPAILRAWAPPERIKPSTWAERHRRIVAKDAAEPGPWRFDRAPYLREVVDAFGPDDPVEEIVWQAAARVGKSETIRNALGFAVDQEPGPMLCVYPTEQAAVEQIRKEITPLIEQTPILARHMTDSPRDVKVGEIELTPLTIYIGWSGSAQSLASRTIRYVFLDEVDKHQAFAGKDADSVSLARRRTQTWKHQKKIGIFSTPTTDEGPISRAFKACEDRRYYHVPCPRCGDMQRLNFSGVKWETRPGEAKRQTASRLEQEQGAWYECASCHGQMREIEKPHMLLAGSWRSEGFDGDERPVSRRRGYAISALYSLLGITWSDIAALFLRAMAAKEEGDLGPLFEWRTQVIGEPFENQVGAIRDDMFAAKKAKGHAPRVVPRWGGYLVACADTQRDGFWWTVRAWGAGERSRLIDRGRAATFEDLERLTIGGPGYPVDGYPTERAVPAKLYIDAGGGSSGEDNDRSLTDKVYTYAKSRPGRVFPLKGWGGNTAPTAPVQERRVEYTPPGVNRSPYDVTLLMIDTQHFKDCLAALLGPAEQGAAEKWEVCSDIDAEYVAHMTAERKVVERKGGQMVSAWRCISGRPNHYFDTEIYQLAAARMLRLGTSLPDEATLEQARERRKRPAQSPQAATGSSGGNPWVDGRGWWDR